MNIALIAHDAKKKLMQNFCIAYKGILSQHNLCATGTTGGLISDATGLPVNLFLSGPQGGDQQIGAPNFQGLLLGCCPLRTHIPFLLPR